MVESANLCVISSNIDALWCLQMIALWTSLGSRQTLRVPLPLQGYVSELIQGVSSIFGMITSSAVISLSYFVFSSLTSVGTLCLICCTGGVLGSGVMEHLPGLLPIVLKESGNMFFKYFVLTVLWFCYGEMVMWWSCNGGMVAVWSWKGCTVVCSWIGGKWLVLWMCSEVKKCVSDGI